MPIIKMNEYNFLISAVFKILFVLSTLCISETLRAMFVFNFPSYFEVKNVPLIIYIIHSESRITLYVSIFHSSFRVDTFHHLRDVA